MKKLALLLALLVLPIACNVVYGQDFLKGLTGAVVEGVSSLSKKKKSNTEIVKEPTDSEDKEVSQSKNSNDEITLMVTGNGNSREDATNNALRSAIAQTYGVFVSANTQLLNDSLIKDEIATVTSGNIKKYKEVASMNLPDGRTEVTIQATVCISKLISYAESKGATAEFAGATFARNLKIKELNKKNEKEAIENMMVVMQKAMPLCYDRKLEISEPTLSQGDNSQVIIPMQIEYAPNKNLQSLLNSVYSILSSLSLSKSEIDDYDNLNMPFFCISFGDADWIVKNHSGGSYIWIGTHDYYYSQTIFVLRNDYSQIFTDLEKYINKFFCDFSIKDNLGNISSYKGTISLRRVSEHSSPYNPQYDGHEKEGDIEDITAEGLFYSNRGSIQGSSLPVVSMSGGNIIYFTIGHDINNNPYFSDNHIRGYRISGSVELLWCVEGNISLNCYLSIPMTDIDKYSKFDLVNN